MLTISLSKSIASPVSSMNFYRDKGWSTFIKGILAQNKPKISQGPAWVYCTTLLCSTLKETSYWTHFDFWWIRNMNMKYIKEREACDPASLPANILYEVMWYLLMQQLDFCTPWFIHWTPKVDFLLLSLSLGMFNCFMSSETTLTKRVKYHERSKSIRAQSSAFTYPARHLKNSPCSGLLELLLLVDSWVVTCINRK